MGCTFEEDIEHNTQGDNQSIKIAIVEKTICNGDCGAVKIISSGDHEQLRP